MDHPTSPHTLDAIARPGGAFAMIAIDARESMRAILRDAGRPHDDDDLRAFKTIVARELGDLPSAVLCDLRFGEPALQEMRRTHPDTGLIVAVDHFDEDRLGPLRETRLDEDAVARAVAIDGVVALKLYLFWRAGSPSPARLDDARRFVELCREHGVVSLIEGVVTPADHADFDDELVRAAEAFGAAAPDVYKTQLPTFGRADDAEIERQSQRVSDAVGVPWVVLSNGVAQERFADAVAATGRGGASGLLAGRAVWRPSLATADPARELALEGRARVAELLAVVDAHATPWREASRR